MDASDWIVAAAWVQALGSIAAIVAAVWIGNRQHRQSVEFVADERSRVQREEQSRRRDLQRATTILLNPLLEQLSRLLGTLEAHAGLAPLPGTALTQVGANSNITALTLEQVKALERAFAFDALHLVIHAQLLRAVSRIDDELREIIEGNSRRHDYAREVVRPTAFGITVPTGLRPPSVDPSELASRIEHLRDVAATVGAD